jgi:ethanolamine utilization protein EutQ (cupin superfamily)
MSDRSAVPPSQALSLNSLVTSTAHGIASRVLAKTAGGNVTLFAFDALVLVQEGALDLTIGGQPVRATPGTVVLMPGGVPHALDAPEAARMLLVMLREPKAG